MSALLDLTDLLAQSDRLHTAWREALPADAAESADGLPLRDRLTLDACALTLEHGRALRGLIEEGLETSALALMRVQHEALLRAAWLWFAASESDIQALAAPQTFTTLKRANSLPLARELLESIENSDAPPALKRGLREFREQSWAGANSYTHAGLLPLGRIGSGHVEVQLGQAVQVSNAHSYSANMLIAAIVGDAGTPGAISLIALSHPGCMLRA